MPRVCDATLAAADPFRRGCLIRSAPRASGNCESYVVFRPSPQIDDECVLSLPIDCRVAAPAVAVEYRSTLRCRRHPNPPDAWLSGQISLLYLSCLQFNIRIKVKEFF